VSHMADPRVESLLRQLAPEVLGAVVRRCRDFAQSEDAVQEAMIAAAEQWQVEGIPDNPRGWLVRVALRRVADQVRSEVARHHREAAVGADEPPTTQPDPFGEPLIDPSDTLVLFFMCCHPALTTASAIALTLRAVGGLTTPEIARAFLVPESTIGQRISRAKQTIKTSRIPFKLPAPGEYRDRLSAVLHVLYLIFNEGYTTTSGDALQRTDLSNEAIRLARAVCQLLPESGEAAGLLALMLLTDARRAARTGPAGELIPLDEQDRARWDQEAIAEGITIAESALSKGEVGEYQLQAAIAAVHDEAAVASATDWPQIRALYAMLLRLGDNPMVVINHAIASAMVDGPEAGLALLAPLDGDEHLRDNHRLDAVRAHLLERAGDLVGALELYRRAAAKTTSLPERNYLRLKAARLVEEE
jgi:RNA polymerase sigma factor (sigma-70 family)